MAQEDYVIADQTGVSFLGDLNNTLAAIVSSNSGATQPSIMYAYQLWADTNAGILKQRNSANNAWIDILTLAGIKSSDIRNTAAGNIAATTVQSALNELDSDKAALAGATFTGQAKGITPVDDEDFTRKDYVDASLGSITPQLVKAWMNFDGSGSIVIRDSYNFSSVVDIQAGIYDCNFSTARVSNDYAVSFTAGDDQRITTINNTLVNVGSFRIHNKSGSNFVDTSIMMVTVVGA